MRGLLSSRPVQLIIIGFFMVVAGWVIPFLMIMQVIESSFLLSFLSYACSVGGILLGVVGAAMYTAMHRK